MDLWSCKLSMLPDSFSQLIHLEFLNVSYCEMLSSLPNGFGNLTSLKSINLWNCEQLSMLPDSFSQLIHLGFLDLSHCKMLSSLPSFAHLASLNTFIRRNCPKVEKIEGLEHTKSLKILEILTCWKVPGIESLENVERLEELELRCDTISALKPCIQSLKGKECPRKMRIQGSVIRLVEAIVMCLEFPDLAITEMDKLRRVYKIPCAEHLDAFLCFVEGNDEEEVLVWYGWDFHHLFPVFSRQDYFSYIGKGRVMWGKGERV